MEAANSSYTWRVLSHISRDLESKHTTVILVLTKTQQWQLYDSLQLAHILPLNKLCFVKLPQKLLFIFWTVRTFCPWKKLTDMAWSTGEGAEVMVLWDYKTSHILTLNSSTSDMTGTIHRTLHYDDTTVNNNMVPAV
jgi:hypothetical protein